MAVAIGLPCEMRSGATSPWTDERIERLKTRWSQGASARQIARELGHGISRSAVLGKIHRLGIAGMSPHAGARGQQPAGKILRGRRRGTGLGVVAQQPLPAWVIGARPYVDDPLRDAGIPMQQRRPLLGLSDGTCRWPVGDPASSDFFFCGAEPIRGKPYCAAHCARAYRPETEAMQRAPNARPRASEILSALGHGRAAGR
jgi:GcrA cell cycle regulator